jgi:type I restriction enzyme S subunit
MAAVEKAKKAAEERLEAAKALPAAYLREVFPTEEDELSDGWNWVKLGDVCGLITGNTPSRSNPSFYGGDTPWANPSNLGDERIISETNEYLTPSGVNKSRLVPANSILMTCISGALRQIGKMGIAGVELTTNQQITSLVPKDGLDSVFTYYSMQTMKPVLESLAASTNQNILNKSKLSSVCFGLPSVEEQRRISRELDDKLAGIKLAEESIQQELETIEAMPAALLRKAFAGEL